MNGEDKTMKKTIKIKSRIDTFELDLNIPENWNEEKIVVACHGFNSSKDSEAMMLIEEDLSKYFQKAVTQTTC